MKQAKPTDAVEKYTKELAELKDRFALRGILAEVESFVSEAKWCDKASKFTKTLRAISKSLTELSKAASERLISHDFEKYFEIECQALDCPKISLDFSGKKGETERRKRVVPTHRVSEILSDGEQKVVALADFLAEVSVKDQISPIIFDDPISSLDYKRMGQVVERLVRLSEKRQIIVFTHNIWFAIELIQRFKKTDCSYYEIRESAGSKGIVEKGEHPSADTWNNLKSKINRLLVEAKKSTEITKDALIKSAYSTMRSACEVLVEEYVFKGVIKRFQPNISMTKLPTINEKCLKVANEVILPIFDKCCRKMDGHSQPLETLNCKPSLEELEKDWTAIQAAAKEILPC